MTMSGALCRQRVAMRMCVLLGLLAGLLANTWALPTTTTVGNLKETTTTEGVTKIYAADNTTTDTTATTESTRSPKSETEAEAVFNSYTLQTAAPARQCGRRFARNARIVGGDTAYEGEFPWAVSVRLLNAHYCGGAIINEYWVLTAAHCVKRYSARYFRVRKREHDVSVNVFRPDLDIYVAELSMHPRFGYPRRYSNDLALLRLKKPLSFDAYTQPICLPDPDQDLEGRNATVVGWGWMTEPPICASPHPSSCPPPTKPKRLQKVQVPLLNNTICGKWYSEVYGYNVTIFKYQVCAGYQAGGRDACKGDSGGPLVMKDGDHFSIIGVVSAGVGCAREHLPGIYSRVSVFVPWIQKVTGVNY